MKPPTFPRTCGCGGVIADRREWMKLPAARGGLHAMGMEWRNHTCGSTLVVEHLVPAIPMSMWNPDGPTGPQHTEAA